MNKWLIGRIPSKKILNVKLVMKSMNKVKEYEPTMITLRKKNLSFMEARK
jgi:hypothetical protein